MTRPALLLATLALALGACDAADAPAALSNADLDDAAVVVAQAVALDAGGVLEDAALGASLAVPVSVGARHPGPDRPGCTRDRTYDDTAFRWTVSVDCQRGRPAGRFSAAFARTSTYQFLDADGAPQRERDGAAGIGYGVVSGTSRVQTPRGVHQLTGLTADLTLSDLGADLVTVDGTVERSVADTLRSRRGTRTLVATLALALDGIQGPRSTTRQWRAAVAGTITGTLQGTLTRTPRGGETETVALDQSFTVTFPTEGRGRTAEIALGGRRWRANVETGEIARLGD